MVLGVRGGNAMARWPAGVPWPPKAPSRRRPQRAPLFAATHHILLARRHKHKVLGLVREGCLKVLAHNALPGGAVLFIALPLDVGADLTVLLGAARQRQSGIGRVEGGSGEIGVGEP